MRRIPGTDLDVFPLCLGGNVFGWSADRDTSFAILDAYAEARATKGQPTMIVAGTVKGKGISFTEGKDNWHGKAFKKGEELDAVLAELHVARSGTVVAVGGLLAAHDVDDALAAVDLAVGR